MLINSKTFNYEARTDFNPLQCGVSLPSHCSKFRLALLLQILGHLPLLSHWIGPGTAAIALSANRNVPIFWYNSSSDALYAYCSPYVRSMSSKSADLLCVRVTSQRFNSVHCKLKLVDFRDKPDRLLRFGNLYSAPSFVYASLGVVQSTTKRRGYRHRHLIPVNFNLFHALTSSWRHKLANSFWGV